MNNESIIFFKILFLSKTFLPVQCMRVSFECKSHSHFEYSNFLLVVSWSGRYLIPY